MRDGVSSARNAPSWLGKTFRRYAPAAAAFFWRRLMFRTCFVAITGSFGKSTATRCLGAVLSRHGPTNWTDTTNNNWRALAERVRSTRFQHRYTVIEVGTKMPGALRRAAWMVAPDVVIVLAVARVHSNNFPDLEAIAVEKASLFSRQSRKGLVILNAGDPRVLAMREKCRGRVLTFGGSPENDLWFSDVSARWPEPLRFRAHHGTQSVEVRTGLVGEHWVPSVCGALLGSAALGVRLEDTAAVIRDIRPVRARMDPAPLPGGVTVLRDDFTGTYSTLPAALRVLGQVDARRVFIGGDPADGLIDTRQRLRQLGTDAAGAADMAIFVGTDMDIARQAAVEAGLPECAAAAFERWQEAAEFLRRELRSGDVVLLRCSYSGHFERIYFRQLGSVACEIDDCGKLISCDACPQLGFQPFDASEMGPSPPST